MCRRTALDCSYTYSSLVGRRGTLGLDCGSDRQAAARWARPTILVIPPPSGDGACRRRLLGLGVLAPPTPTPPPPRRCCSSTKAPMASMVSTWTTSAQEAVVRPPRNSAPPPRAHPLQERSVPRRLDTRLVRAAALPTCRWRRTVAFAAPFAKRGAAPCARPQPTARHSNRPAGTSAIGAEQPVREVGTGPTRPLLARRHHASLSAPRGRLHAPRGLAAVERPLGGPSRPIRRRWPCGPTGRAPSGRHSAGCWSSYWR